MDKIRKRWLMPWMVCLLISCTEDHPNIRPAFVFEDGTEVTIGSDAGDQAQLAFNSSATWKASGQAEWYSLSPTYGKGGDGLITVMATAGNYTGEERKDTFTLRSGNLARAIIVTQAAGKYVKTEQSEYHVAAEGGYLEVNFSSNLNSQDIVVSSEAEWLAQPQTKTAMAGAQEYFVPLSVMPNTGNTSRTAYLDFYYQDTAGYDILLTTVTITQDGNGSGYSSTDYSADKTLRVMQTATAGSGIPFVLMGDGFVDTDIADGTYDKVMDRALENLFSEEPIRSLRDYFTVYAVTAVSKNGEFGRGYETAFGCQMEGNGSTGISGNEETVVEYAQCVEGIDMANTLAVVVLNSTEYAGTTYFGFTNSSGSSYNEFAIAYCPVINGLEDEKFRQVLTHEAIGHGFTKLYDEYAYEAYGAIPQTEVLQTQYLQRLMGWAANVDFTSDPDKVLWTRFLHDDRYAGEGLGVFEGACTYWSGAYRPSEESMMNNNTEGFNAPSRQAIFNKVMKLGEGRTPDYEEFVTFDRQTATGSGAKRTATPKSAAKAFAPPRLTNKTLF